MTAQLAEYAIAAPVRPRRRGARVQGGLQSYAPSSAGRLGTPWVHVASPERHHDVAPVLPLRPAPVAAAPLVVDAAPRPVAEAERYAWTPRGLAVLVALAVLLFVVMASTLVTSFLAVSNEPFPPQQAQVVTVSLSGR